MTTPDEGGNQLIGKGPIECRLGCLLDDAPQAERIEADTLAALMCNLSVEEKNYVLDTIKRFCALVARGKSKKKSGKPK